MRFASLLVTVSVLLVFVDQSAAQPGRGGRGADAGQRGGFGSGGGDRGGSGGDRGGYGARGGGALGGGGPGGGGPPGGGMSRLDANGNGRIDQDEIDKIPEGFRSMMESRGMRLQPGTSVDDFRNRMRSQFEQMRQEREREESQYRPQAQQQQQRPTGNRTEYKPSSSFRPPEKERMTIDLPANYTDLDTDFDGQVGLYEWIVAKRDELELFDAIDIDKDGILTPRELDEHDNAVTSPEQILASLSERYKRPRVTIIGGPSATGLNRGGSETKNLSKEVKEQHTSFASKQAFPYIDTNKDGRITLDELQRDEKTKRVIGMFEKANIKVEPMSQAEFTQRYVQAMDHFAGLKAKGSDGGGGERRDRDGGRVGPRPATLGQVLGNRIPVGSAQPGDSRRDASGA